MSTPGSRRQFLKTTAALATGALAGRAGRAWAANEVLNVACIGAGGRCRALMKSLAAVPGVRLAAVCDIWDVAREEARKLADPRATVWRNYQEVLGRKDIDAVLIGSPDHWHVPMTADACAAGKDV